MEIAVLLGPAVHDLANVTYEVLSDVKYWYNGLLTPQVND